MLSNKVKLWNIRVELFEELEGKHGVNYWKKLFQIYVDLMECYKMHNFCYQAPIVYYLIDVSIHSLVYIQAVISMVQDGFENTSIVYYFLQTFIHSLAYIQAAILLLHHDFNYTWVGIYLSSTCTCW
ncbi:hypothetical protein HF086_007691 [Spodoptera exigua]|uniref:Uncharacterized protein n=1 Tax=Spodoptera exigua TaxID=7107 RepID=A0A922SNC1_SPOEX|nr:hypothetical protein HF086_007691 [Spodoptera exigua]